MITLHIPEAIAIGFLVFILGISIGQLIGQWSMKPIIRGHQNALEIRKETCDKRKEMYEELTQDYLNLMRKYHDLG